MASKEVMIVHPDEFKNMVLGEGAMDAYKFALEHAGVEMTEEDVPAFISARNAKTSAFLAIFRKIIVLVPLIFILPPFFPAEAKTFAVWLAEPIADVAAVTMTTTLFRCQFKTAMEQLTTV